MWIGYDENVVWCLRIRNDKWNFSGTQSYVLLRIT